MGWLTETRNQLVSALTAPAPPAVPGPPITAAPPPAAAGPAAPAAPPPGAAGAAPPEEPVDKLDAVAKWLAGAFVLLSTILTFIGIKEGQLDRVLRNEPRGALFVFLLVGLAVVGGVVAPAVGPEKRIRLGLVVLALGVPLVVAGPFLPDLGDGPGISGRWAAVAIVGGLLVVGGIAFVLFDLVTSLKAGTIAVALLLFAIGMYGAFKLSVAAKAAKDRPSITAAFVIKEARPMVTVSLKASGLRTDEHLSGTVRGYGARTTNRDLDVSPCGENCLLLYGFRVGADETGAIETTFDVPLTPGDFARVSIRAHVCQGRATSELQTPVPNRQAEPTTSGAPTSVPNRQMEPATSGSPTSVPNRQMEPANTDTCEPTKDKSAYLDLRLPAAPDRPQLTMSVKPAANDGSQVDISPAMEGLGGDTTVAVRVFIDGGSGRYQQIAAFDIAPAASGEATPATTPSVVVGAGTRRVCATGTIVRPGRPSPPSGCDSGTTTVVLQQDMPLTTTTVAMTG